MSADELRIVPYRGKWAAVIYPDGERKRLSLELDVTGPKENCPNYPKAQCKAADLRRALAQPKSDTVGDIVDAYLKDKDRDEGRAVTIEYMKWMWGVLKPHCAGLRPDQIDRDWCRSYTAKRGKSAGTIRKELAFLAAALAWVKGKGNGRGGAVFELPPAPVARDRWLSKMEFTLLLEAARPHPHLVVFLHLAIATGARKEAILDLRWPKKDTPIIRGGAEFPGVVDFDAGVVRLGRKLRGKARATVPMTKSLRTVLQAAKLKAETEFVVEFGGAGVGDIKKAFATAVKNAGLHDVTPHDLRHTAAVWQAAAGVSMDKIAQYLGHSDSRITEKVYARFAPEHLRDAADALEINLGPSALLPEPGAAAL